MVLWRISRHRDLSGIGGLRASGRWHYAGQPVVYLSESPSSALLEVCVHTSANDVPPDFTLLRVVCPELKVEAVSEDGLADGWQVRLEVTQEIGTRWLRESRSALLRIPSAIVPHTANFLFNPLHADAGKLQIAEAELSLRHAHQAVRDGSGCE
jgi:RES domain-containing protein